MRAKTGLLLVTIVCLSFGTSAAGSFVVYDHFDDGVLDPSWTVESINSTGWSYSESGTEFTVTDIVPEVLGGYGEGTVSYQKLTRTFAPLDDFDVSCTFSWDSEESLNATQKVMLMLYDATGYYVAGVAYEDIWVVWSGQKAAAIGEKAYYYDSGYDSMPLAGSATVEIHRQEGEIDILWNGESILTGVDSTPVETLKIQFRYTAYDGPEGTSFFGTESVDVVALTPEPASMLLLALGGLAILRRRRS